MWSFVRPIFKQLDPCFTQDTELWYPILSNKERILLFFSLSLYKIITWNKLKEWKNNFELQYRSRHLLTQSQQ